MQFLKYLNSQEGITLVMVTHEREIAAHASRVVEMKDGNIVSDSMNE